MRTDIYNSDEEIEKELFEILEESEKSERNCLMIFNAESKLLLFLFSALYGMIFLTCILRNLNFGECFQNIIIQEILMTTAIVTFSFLILNCFFLIIEKLECNKDFLLTLGFVLLEFMWLDTRYFQHSLSEYILLTKWNWGYEVVVLFLNGLFIHKLTQYLTENDSKKDIIVGVFLFLVWNYFQLFLAIQQPIIAYHESLVITNLMIFGGILASRTNKKNTGKKALIFLGYSIVLLISLFSRENEWNHNIFDFLFGENGFSGYVTVIRRLLSDLKFFGPAYEGYVKDVVVILRDDLSPIRSLLVYYGIFPTVIFMTALIGILVILFRLVLKVKGEGVYFALAISGFSHLLMRFLIGSLYELAVCPIKIALPFIGENNMFDYSCVSIILVAWYRFQKSPQKREDFLKSLFWKVIEFLSIDEDQEKELEELSVYGNKND